MKRLSAWLSTKIVAVRFFVRTPASHRSECSVHMNVRMDYSDCIQATRDAAHFKVHGAFTMRAKLQFCLGFDTAKIKLSTFDDIAENRAESTNIYL